MGDGGDAVVTAASALDSVAGYVPKALVAPESVTRIRATAVHLPSADIAGFEIRLGDPQPVADYAACWVLGKRFPTFPGRPEFAAVRACLERAAWCDPGFQVPNITLEYDTSKPGPFSLVPNIYLAVNGEDPDRLVTDVIPTMRGGPLPPRVAAVVRRCLERAPVGPWVIINGLRVCKGLFQLGVMVARGHDGVRLCFHLPFESDITAYLRAIEWPGDLGKVSVALGRLAWSAGSVSLAIDVGERVEPRIGFELNLHPLGARTKLTKRWKQFLDTVLDEGLCLPEKYEPLFRWPGEDPRRGAYRFLHHAKIVLTPEEALEVKVYLGYVVRPQEPEDAHSRLVRSRNRFPL